jgi:hypothetical protein
VAPKPLPVNVTCVPGSTLVGEIFVRLGGVIVKLIPLLLAPFCVMEANPAKVPAFTVATTELKRLKAPTALTQMK